MVRESDICIYPYDKHYYSNISSASLNNAFANHKPVVAYPTDSFVELNKRSDALVLPSAFSYYELAREIERINIKESTEKSKRFANMYSYEVVTRELVTIYKNL